jgi:hypothetical protein
MRARVRDGLFGSVNGLSQPHKAGSSQMGQTREVKIC